MKWISLFLPLLVFACQKKNTEVAKTVTNVPVRRGTLQGKLAWKGIVRSANRIEIRADKKLKIAKVHAKNFDTVTKGQLLIEVDKTETLTKVAELSDKLQMMQLEFDSAEIKLRYNEKVMNRKKVLKEKGIIAQKEMEEALREFRLTEGEIKGKQLELDKLKRELSENREALKTSNFYAPMDGTLSGLINYDPAGGAEASAGTLLAVVSDPKDLALWVQVEETNTQRVSSGMPAEVYLDSTPGQVMPGKVLNISPNSSQNEASRMRTYEMSVGFEAKGVSIREGFGGEASIVFAKRENAITMPLSAVRYSDGKNYALAADGEKRSGTAKPVELGLKTDTEAEVLSGLSEKDFVVIDVD